MESDPGFIAALEEAMLGADQGGMPVCLYTLLLLQTVITKFPPRSELPSSPARDKF